MSNQEAPASPGRTLSFDVAVIGGGGAAETFVAELDGSGLSVVVFEEFRVGGECPFVACMPTKGMLHDAAIGRTWTEAVRRRRDVVEGLEDDGHADELRAHGAELVRERAAVSGIGEVIAAGDRYQVDHIVLATGSEPLLPPIDGLESIGDRLWTSADAMTVDERPTRLTILGGGVIGCEMATIFARFGTEVHLLDNEARAFPALPAEIGEIADDALRARGIRVHRGSEVVHVEPRGGGVRVRLGDGPCLDTDRLLVATGTRPCTSGIGLDTIGLDDGAALTVADDGRVDAPGSMWAMGDVAGRGEYTHLANHQARVVAGAISGRGDRRFDDVAVPACVFTDPPIITIGPTPDRCGDDVVWVTARLSEVARFTTDDLVDGVLHVGVERSSGALRAAHGIGAGFDILATALVTAIDTRVPVHRLARSMSPFPTIGEILPLVYSRASSSVDVD
jgi:pyruvate/2-oxoglutarate dehydrogenase complex dihydrolipoamide dehydrogenase (E3) component